jgi:hypothetical protein
MTKQPSYQEGIDELLRDFLAYQEGIDELWRDFLTELRRRGYDLGTMRDGELADLWKRLAQARPSIAERTRQPSALSRLWHLLVAREGDV